MDPTDPRYAYPRRNMNINIPLLQIHPASNSETDPTPTTYIAPPSSACSLLSPSTQTSSDLHLDLPDSSLFASTVTNHDSSTFIWNDPPSHPVSPTVEDEPLSRDATFFLPYAASSHVPSASNLNYDDELSLVTSLLESPQAIFDLCIRRLRRQFEDHRDQRSFARELLEFVMARDPLLVPLPEIPVSNGNRSRSLVDAPSPSHSTRSHGPHLYVCVLCPERERTEVTSRGSLKRHVSDHHRAKSEFRCPFRGCNWKKNRRDKLRDHLRRHGYIHLSKAEISQLEFPLPVPTVCEVCSRNPPFQSWDEWFECIESHCRREPPQPGSVSEPPDGQGGNGTGGTGFSNGGFFPGAPGAGGGFLNPGGSSGITFMGNGGGYQQYWPGTGHNASIFVAPESSCERNLIRGKRLLGFADTGASRQQISTPCTDTASDSSQSSTDSRDGPFSVLDRRIGDDGHITESKDVPRPPPVDSQDGTPQKCRRCGHVSTSCPDCPADGGPAEWCHKCKDNVTLPVSSRLFNFIGNYGRYQDLACNGVSDRTNMRYEIGYETIASGRFDLSRPTVRMGYIEHQSSSLISPKFELGSVGSLKSPSSSTEKRKDQTGVISKTPFPTSAGIALLDQNTLICSVLQLKIVFGIIVSLVSITSGLPTDGKGWSSVTCFLKSCGLDLSTANETTYLERGESGTISSGQVCFQASGLSTKESPKTFVDALTVCQKTLGLIHQNPPASRQFTTQHIQRFCLDAIQVELTTSLSPTEIRPQQCRRKRLSASWTRLRAVVFFLSLQTAVAPRTKGEHKPKAEEHCPDNLEHASGTDVSTWCMNPFGPFFKQTGIVGDLFRDVRSMSRLIDMQRSPGIFTFLRNLVTKMSDTRSSPPCGEAGAGALDELYPILLDVFSSIASH
ncbi:hypothetical protein VTN77DRAFT_2176 [Rasamsonia byssochlamydoides]|uniref:uncharacterized protein n=1 Tax=Rasamsonia byssochlamydoides TaxID=89139 RepID=UPI0037440FA6